MKRRADVHRLIYLLVLTLLGGCMVTSTWASNLMWTLLGVNWLFEGRWREKWQMACESRLLQALWLLLLCLAVTALRGSDLMRSLSELQVMLPLVIVGTVTLTTPAVIGRTRHNVLWLFAGTVFVVSIISVMRLLVIPDLPYREAVPYISHIRFSLCCCMTLFIAWLEPLEWRHFPAILNLDRRPPAGNTGVESQGAVTVGGRRSKGARVAIILRVALALWMVAFVMIIRSYTAVAVLLLAPVAALLLPGARRRRLWLCLWAAALLLIVGAVALECRNYYRPSALAQVPLATATANGRPYSHRNPSVVECGSRVEQYVCMEEMSAQWSLRSTVPLDGCDAKGYPLEATLMRYLNALGLTKDSAGLAQLTDAQVREVESGVPNPLVAHGNPLRRMVYPLLFEWECYRCHGAVLGSSALQRLELWRATLRVIKRHPWTGVPATELTQAIDSELDAMHSSQAGSRLRAHNQYLTLAATLGLPVCLLLLVVFLRAVPALRRQCPLLAVWVAAVLLSFLTENTLGTNAGILFCTFFLAFRRQTD